ncbi:MAG: hypothetical protein AAGE52_04080 [Myxococcota bacterium]
MPGPRTEKVDLSLTNYYLCTTTTARGGFLAGTDPISGKNLSHRRGWVRDRVHTLAELTTVDICAYSVTETQLQVLLHIDADRNAALSEDEVVERYGALHPVALKGYEAMNQRAKKDARKKYRARLGDLSWVMRALNEHIARLCNREDGSRGHFWLKRFHTQALIDDVGLLMGLCRVDLKLVHEGFAKTPTGSDYTSIQERIRAHKKGGSRRAKAPEALVPFEGQRAGGDSEHTIPFHIDDYLALVDWSAKHLSKPSKADPPALLSDLGIPGGAWVTVLKDPRMATVTYLGSITGLEDIGDHTGKRKIHGKGLARILAGLNIHGGQLRDS